MEIFSKLLILISTVFSYSLFLEINYKSIACLLITICIGMLPITKISVYIDKENYKIAVNIYSSIILIYIAIGVLSPYVFLSIPLAMLGFMQLNGTKKLYLPLIINLIAAVNYKKSYSIYEFISVAVVVALAILMSKITSLEKELRIQRDTGKEKNLLLIEQNKKVLEGENEKIYYATLKERNRIAREIHDNVGHTLTRSILQVGAIEVINKDEVLKEPIKLLHASLDDAMNNIRKSVHDLYDDSVDMKKAIKDIVADQKKLKVDFIYDVENIKNDIKYAFIAIVKEAYTNAIKYSNGDKFTIIIREHPGMYQLMVSDNGRDIRMDESKKGIGLMNIKDRVAGLKGNIEINTNDGFCIKISVLKKQ